jgi:adhesin transport system membrane fusion protein
MSNLLELLKGDDAELEEQEFAAKRSAGMILWIILAFVGLFLIWAWLTELDRSVNAMGRVVPSSKMQIVSNFEGGVVEQILVKSGQMVKKGDILVRLSPTMSSAEQGSNSASVDSLRAKVARLSAEVRGASPNYSGVPAGQIAIEQSLHRARSAELSGLVAAGNAALSRPNARLQKPSRSLPHVARASMPRNASLRCCARWPNAKSSAGWN